MMEEDKLKATHKLVMLQMGKKHIQTRETRLKEIQTHSSKIKLFSNWICFYEGKKITYSKKNNKTYELPCNIDLLDGVQNEIKSYSQANFSYYSCPHIALC